MSRGKRVSEEIFKMTKGQKINDKEQIDFPPVRDLSCLVVLCCLVLAKKCPVHFLANRT